MANVSHFHCQQLAALGSPPKTVHNCLVCENIRNLNAHNKTQLVSAYDTETRIRNHPLVFLL